jgi:hypothetical protein
MIRSGHRLRSVLAVGAVAACLAGGGVVIAQSEQEPTPAAPAVSPDPIGDLLKETAPSPAPATPSTPSAPEPTVITPQPAPASSVPVTAVAEPDAETAEEETETAATSAEAEPVTPGARRARRPVAIVQAIDKITAESMRFEVRVGGPPVRFGTSLIITARACEVSAADEPVRDSAAYLEIRSQPRGGQQPAAARQVFRGWMYASAPAVTRLEHPIYDAWVVGCRA